MSGSIRQQSINNERTKLVAAAIDRASTACFVVGFIGPLATAASITGQGGLAWLGVGIVLHIAARWVLGGIQ